MEGVFMAEQPLTSFTSSGPRLKRRLKGVAGKVPTFGTILCCHRLGRDLLCSPVARWASGPEPAALNPIQHLRDELEQQDFSPGCCGTWKSGATPPQSPVERSGVQILTGCPHGFSDSTATTCSQLKSSRLGPLLLHVASSGLSSALLLKS